jgi:monoamine oxidase
MEDIKYTTATSPSRFELSIFLMQAVEARFPRLIPRKPILAGVPLDFFALHQAVLYFGGYQIVEQYSLWAKVAEQILPSHGKGVSITKSLSGNKQQDGQFMNGSGARDVRDSSLSMIPPQVIAQIRDKALRYLAWIEDEAPSARVTELQEIARRHSMRPIPFESLTSGLKGGDSSQDLGKWMMENGTNQEKINQDVSVSCGVPGIYNLLRIHKNYNPTINSNDETRKRDRSYDDIDNDTKRQRGIDVESREVKFEKCEFDTLASSNIAQSEVLATVPVLQNSIFDNMVQLVDVNSLHADDANRLYKLYNTESMLLGAYATHTNPLDITDEEEAAFPHYSRTAHASTVYSESQRRDTLRSNNAVFVIPSQGDTSDSIIIFALPPENDVNAIGAALMAGKPLPLSLPFPKSVVASGMNYAGGTISEGNNLSVLNNIISVLSSQPLRVSSAPPVPRALMKTDDYIIGGGGGGGGGGIVDKSTESKKKTSKFDPLVKRISEGIEQEPHVGLSVTRVQFLVDLRNHILLKWIQSQNPVNEMKYNSRRNDAMASVFLGKSSSQYSTTSLLFQEANEKKIGSIKPTHPSWNGSMTFQSIGNSNPISNLQIQRSVGSTPYRLPGPLMLREVLSTIPARFHEAAATLFDFLEGIAKINIGAISVRLDETIEHRSIPYRIPWEILSTTESMRIEFAQSSSKKNFDKVIGPTSTSSYKRRRIAVIGAGISGLAAARQLSFFGHDVIVIEAQDRPGGRIRTERGILGQPVDEGAMISTGAEPNPFALISRQLNLRTHEISNLEAPLLLPQSYRKRVLEMAQAREKRSSIVIELKKRAALQLEAQTAARNAVHAAAVAAARARESLCSDILLRKEIDSDLLYLDTGAKDPMETLTFVQLKSDLGISLPQDLSYIPDAITAQVLRLYSAHATFVAEHVIFLERVLKCLTSLSLAQSSNRSECLQYGVVLFNQPNKLLPLSTRKMLDCVHLELQRAKNWLMEPISKRIIDMIRLVIKEQAEATKLRHSIHSLHSESQSLCSKTSDSYMNDTTSTLLTDSNTLVDISIPTQDSVGVVLVPQSIDAEVAEDHNAFLERAHQFRLRESPPAYNECLFSFPLLRGSDTINFVPNIKVQTPPPGYIITGNEMTRTETNIGRNPHDPWSFSFASGSEGGILGCSIKTWTTDIYPRRRVFKYIDPRRTDDDVDGAFEHLDRVPGEATASTMSSQKDSSRLVSTLIPSSSSHTTLSIPAQSSSTLNPRKIVWGTRPTWDCSLGLALEMMATADDADRVNCGGLRPDLASTVNTLRQTSVDGDEALDRLLSSTLSLNSCDADTDGVLASGSSLSLKSAQTQDELTFAALRRALLRWHAANLEYGCAKPLTSVSLQSWDQDDVFTYHDKGRHTFSRDGYDTHIRGMVQDIPVLYNSEVVKIYWDSDESQTKGARVLIKTSQLGSTDLVNEKEISHDEELSVDAVVVTLPIGVLQERYQTLFEPPLPTWKVESIQGLNPGLLNKVIIRFPKAFWRKTSKPVHETEITIDQKAIDEKIDNMASLEPKKAQDLSSSNVLLSSSSFSSLSTQPLVSCLPLMDSLSSSFHLQQTFLSDSRLVSACSLALAASESEPLKSSNISSSDILFSSIRSISETSKLNAAAIELFNNLWSKSNGSKSTEQCSTIGTENSINHKTNNTDAEQVAERIFAIPIIPSPGSALSPSLLSPAAAVAAQRAVELADVEVAVKKDTINIISKLLQKSDDPINKTKSTSNSNGGGISAGDDAFCRVVLGDDITNIRQRGESYMFWAMDRPGEGAKLKLVPSDKQKDSYINFQDFDDKGEEIGQDAVLIAMMAGAAAEWIEEVSDNVAIQSVLSTLRDLFGTETVPEPLSHVVTRWKSNEFARGSYSSLAPGSHGSTYDVLAAPIYKKGDESDVSLPVLFFAGEASNRHHPTTAAGAFDTGIRESVRIAATAGRARDPDVLRILAAREMRIG